MNIGNAPLGVTDGATGIVGGIGIPVTETASIAYDGTLLPTGTASYAGISIDATKRYLKNSGKDKTPALVESGQGKFFNGTSQYINTGIIPNQAQGTLATRFTYVTGQVSRCIIGTVSLSIWVNASGKIEGQFGDVLVASTDVLTNGLSYHVSLSWVGLVATLKVNYVTKASGTATAFNPTNVMYIGARNNVGTADRYFNNVIDETYYYDVALPDIAIQSLYLYPEKVKSYNGAIVPDIGSEANCKLFLPLCENSGSNVVNVAVARGSELVVNGGFDTDTVWGKGTDWTISGGTLIKTAGTTSATSQAFTPTVDKWYAVSLVVTSITTASFYIGFLGGTNNFGGAITTVGTYTFLLQGKTGNTSLYIGMTVDGSIVLDNVSVKEITAYPLASYSTAMHTSAAKLSYGAQCTAWKRDSLGVLLGMSNGLSFDGGVSVKGVSTGWTPTSAEPFIVEAVVKLSNSVLNQSFGTGYLANSTITLGFNSASYLQGSVADKYANNATVSTIGHVVVIWNGTVGQSKMYVNGIELSYTKETSFVNPVTPFYIGSLGVTQKTIMVGTPKIHKGTQYAKFDIAKAWAKAQKTIARLGA